MKQLETSGLESKEVFYTIIFKWFLDIGQLENSGFDSKENFQRFYGFRHISVKKPAEVYKNGTNDNGST